MQMRKIWIFFFCLLDNLSVFESPVTVIAMVSFGQMCLENVFLLNVCIFSCGFKSLVNQN